MRAAVALLCLTACGARSGLVSPQPLDDGALGLVDSASDAEHALPEAAPAACGNCALAFASGPDWQSNAGLFSADGGLRPDRGPALGPARDVCVTSYRPLNCSAGALVYERPDTPWAAGADLPNAHWIWRGDVTLSGLADLQAGAFEQTFDVGPQATGSIQIAVDDFTEVFVNGTSMGTAGSVTSEDVAGAAENTLVTLDLTPALVPGPNVITVVAQNGPSLFGVGCAQECTYSQNPAGVIFAGTLRWQ